jgi:pimeloyl-ACP methyl ester carboxylesterase
LNSSATSGGVTLSFINPIQTCIREEFKKLLPNASLYWVDKCGHAPMMEHPEKFNELLQDWLNKENL